MAESHTVITALHVSLFALIFLVSVAGLRVGRWVAHFGTAATLFVADLLIVLLFVHPHASLAHPHVSPQHPFSLQFPLVTLVSLNLFSKIAFNGFTALEQVAVFAGETRNPARSILRSAWMAAPAIALIYILMTGSLLTYTSATDVDLVNPIAQVIAAAFRAGDRMGGDIDWGVLLGRATILALTLSLIAQAVVYMAETSRLPMVAAWDHLLPVWFTRLHPRYGTPTRSLAVIVLIAVVFSFLASSDAGANEAFQLLGSSGFVCYGINYLLMFAVPLLVGTRFSLRRDLRPSVTLRLACLCGASVTALSMIFNLVPIVDVARPWGFALKVGAAALGINLIGAAIYWRGSRPKLRPDFNAAKRHIPGHLTPERSLAISSGDPTLADRPDTRLPPKSGRARSWNARRAGSVRLDEFTRPTFARVRLLGPFVSVHTHDDEPQLQRYFPEGRGSSNERDEQVMCERR
jgi:amino acid transporter